MSVPCACKLTSAPDAFPVTYDNSACPTHGRDAPRYFVDHGTIHDRVTGKHVTVEQAAILLSSAYDAEAIDYDAIEAAEDAAKRQLETAIEEERQKRRYARE